MLQLENHLLSRHLCRLQEMEAAGQTVDAQAAFADAVARARQVLRSDFYTKNYGNVYRNIIFDE